MKVLLINGSPKKEGCTYTALKEVADELERNGVETEIFHIGTAPVKGCRRFCIRFTGTLRIGFRGDYVIP